MGRYADILCSTGLDQNYIGGGVSYDVQTVGGVIYRIFLDVLNDVVYSKSSDGGFTWSAPIALQAGTLAAVAVWYDRWSGIAAGLIHVAYTDFTLDDTFYRTIDTENADALSTETTLFLGASATVGGGCLTIARARGGNVYCRTTIDGGAEGGFFRLPNANVPNGAWDAARTIDETLATQDQFILVPGFAADNQDMMMVFWDASANEISRKIYDDSANSWAETSISGSMNDQITTTAFPHFAAAVDLTNSRIVLIAWNGVDAANADLNCWTFTESAITAKTDVVLNSTDDQGLCAISIDLQTAYWHAFYAGKSDGSETFLTSLNVYKKISTDSGTTWGAETLLSSAARNVNAMFTSPRWVTGEPHVTVQNLDTAGFPLSRHILPVVRPGARSGVGI